MNKKIKKNILLICIIMLFIHILGLIYQIITHLPTLSILLKELFIILFLIQIVVVKLEIKKYQLICYIVNTIIIIFSMRRISFIFKKAKKNHSTFKNSRNHCMIQINSI